MSKQSIKALITLILGGMAAFIAAYIAIDGSAPWGVVSAYWLILAAKLLFVQDENGGDAK